MQMDCQPPPASKRFVHPLRGTSNSTFYSVTSPQPRKTVQLLPSKPSLSLSPATHGDMVSEGDEGGQCRGRGDGDGEHLPVQPVVVGIQHREVEDVGHGLIAGLKRGGVAVGSGHGESGSPRQIHPIPAVRGEAVLLEERWCLCSQLSFTFIP